MKKSPFTIRPYQAKSAKAILSKFKEFQSTLAVQPTGTGKTVLAAEIIRKTNHGRAMFLAPRNKLVNQAVQAIERHTGENVSVEMNTYWADTNMWNHSRIVASTVQTQYSGQGGQGRMTRFDPDKFSLLVVDEADMYLAPRWRQVVDYYKQNKDLKVLAVTATPDRRDEQALAQLVDSYIEPYEIRDAVKDGWLTPIRARMIYDVDLDFGEIDVRAGDFHQGQLARQMEQEEVMHEIADTTRQIARGRRAVIFCIRVKQAERMAEILNRHESGSAACISQKTPENQREEIYQALREGTIRFLCNVDVATRGWDEPRCEVVVPKPTLSRRSYAQQVGRTLRPLDDLVDGYATVETRRKAIAQSPKPFAEIIDFHGVTGRHRLVHPADILGGKFREPVLARANKAIAESGEAVDVIDEVDRAEEEELREQMRQEREEKERRDAAMRRNLVARARWQEEEINVWAAVGISVPVDRAWDKLELASPAQVSKIRQMTKDKIDASDMTKAQARTFMGTLIQRARERKATFPQINTLKKFGYHDAHKMYVKEASALITKIAKNGWKRPDA